MEKSLFYMKISDLSQKSGVSRHSIHHYLRLGLLPAPQRKNKTMAYYGQEHLERLVWIRQFRDQGVSLYVLQQMLSQNVDPTGLGPEPARLPAVRQGGKNKAIKKRQLIETASKVFSEKGYYHTSISDITEPLGIGKSTFYLYFKNKKELFFICIDSIFDHLWKEDFERIREEKNFALKLALRGEAFIRVYPRIRDILQMMRGALVGNDDGMATKYNEIYAKLVRPVIKDLQKGMEQGRIRQGDPELLAYILVGMAEALAYRVHLDDKYSLKDAMELMTQYRLLR